MKPTLLLASLSLVFASPTLLAESELEKLRALCAEQDRQIRLLEEENSRLSSLVTREKTRAYPDGLISNTPRPSAPTRTESSGSYTVVAGDNLAKIARKNGTTPEAVAKLNGLKMSTLIHPGQKLKVPASQAATASASSSTPAPKPSAPAASGGTHKIQPGETFYSISRKYGISSDALMAANPGVKSSALQVGQTLRLSGGNQHASTPAPPPARETAQKTTPAPTEKSPDNAALPAPQEKKSAIRSITIENEMTYGQFASTHGTNAERLNDLNGLELTSATVLAKGSELYVPAQP